MSTTKKPHATRAKVFLALVAAAGLAGCAPSGPQALLEGERLLHAGKPEAALAPLQRAVTALDRHPQAWNHLGLAQHRLGKAEEAAKAYRQALALDPNLAAARFNLGCLLLENRNPAAAAVELASYTVHAPASVAGWTKRGTAELRARQFEAADQSLRRALHLNPRAAEASNALGVLYAQRSRPREAYQAFAAAAQMQAGYAPALLNQAVIAHTGFAIRPVDYRPGALQKYKEFLALQPRPAQWEAVAGIVRQLESDLAPPAPVAPPVAVAPKAPTNGIVPPAITNPPPARTDTNLKPVVVASTATFTPMPPPPPFKTQLVAVVAPPAPPRPPSEVLPPPPVPVIPAPPSPPPPTPQPAPVLPVAIVVPPVPPPAPPVETIPSTPALGRYAFRNPARPPAGDRRRAEDLHALGAEYEGRGRWREALDAYERAIQADPTMFEAHHNLGLMAGKVNEPLRALRAFESALALQPAALAARFNFALALDKAGYYRDAAIEQEKVVSDYPDEPRARLALGNLYAQQLNQASLARVHYLKLLELQPQHPQGTNIRFWLKANP